MPGALEEPDVIVVGAGPAGSTAARDLAAAGLAVLLLDKDVFPRDKPCAGGITKRALDELGFELPADVVRERCCAFRAVWGDKVQEVVLPEPYAITVDRRDFDQVLVEKAKAAGAVFCPNEAVLGVEAGAGRVTVRTTRRCLSAPLVIGADGVPSRIAAALGERQFPAAHCLSAEVPLPPSEERKRRLHGTLETHWGMFRWGYAWVFPKGSHASVGLGSWDGAKMNLKALWDKFLQSLGFSLAKPRGHLVPLGGSRRRRLGDGILLVGDAAGFADPITGEGIFYAVRSAHLAAETILALKRRGLPYTSYYLRRYDKACAEAFGKDLAWAMVLNQVARRWPKLWQKALFRSPVCFRLALEVACGLKTYRELAFWGLRRLPYLLKS